MRIPLIMPSAFCSANQVFRIDALDEDHDPCLKDVLLAKPQSPADAFKSGFRMFWDHDGDRAFHFMLSTNQLGLKVRVRLDKSDRCSR